MENSTLRRLLASVFLLALVIKLVILAFDHRILFFFGDSLSYLLTSVGPMIPTDRSFIYGWLLKALFKIGLPLQSAIWVNVLASTISCVIVSYCVLVFAPSARRVALIAGLIYALEPVATTMDGYLLTESLSTMLVLAAIASALRYSKDVLQIQEPIRARRILISLAFSLSAALAALQFRSANLLLLYFIICLPVIVLSVWAFPHILQGQRPTFDRRRLINLGSSLAVALVVGIGGLSVYKLGVRIISQIPPHVGQVGVLPEAGLFKLGLVLPLLRCEDLAQASTPVRETICARIEADPTIKDRHSRPAHRWSETGAIEEVVRVAEEGNLSRIEVALELDQAANSVIKRDPLGFTMLGLGVWSDFWTTAYAQESINNDISNDPANLTGLISEILADNFNYEISDPDSYHQSLRTEYYRAALPWLRLLTLTPFLALVFLGLAPKNQRVLAFLFCCMAALCFAPTVFLAERTVFRYFHVIAPLFIIMTCLLWVWRPSWLLPARQRPKQVLQ